MLVHVCENTREVTILSRCFFFPQPLVFFSFPAHLAFAFFPSLDGRSQLFFPLLPVFLMISIGTSLISSCLHVLVLNLLSFVGL